MTDNITDLVSRLEEEAERLSGHSIDRGSVDAGIASNLASEAAQALTRIAGDLYLATNARDNLANIANDAESRAQAAEAERDRLRLTLKQIADLDDVEAALDPEWAIRRAREALGETK